MREDINELFWHDLQHPEKSARFSNDNWEMKLENPSIEKESEVR
jgi:hypothetical protein